jgi:hypothetical protein
MAAAAGGGIMTEGEMLRGKHTSFRSICRCVGGRIRQPYPNGDARLPATAVSRSLTSLPSTSADGRGGGAHSLPPMRTDTATPACACAAQECTEHALQSCTHSRVGTAEHLLRRRRQQQRVRSKAQFSILAHPLLQLAAVRHLDVAATPHSARASTGSARSAHRWRRLRRSRWGPPAAYPRGRQTPKPALHR